MLYITSTSLQSWFAGFLVQRGEKSIRYKIGFICQLNLYFQTPVQYQSRTPQVIPTSYEVMRCVSVCSCPFGCYIWSCLHRCKVAGMPWNFRLTFKASSHLCCACLHVHPRHPQRSKLHTELKSAGVLMRHRTPLSLYWRSQEPGGAWTTAWSRRCTRRTFHNFIKVTRGSCKYVQVLSSFFIWTLLPWRLFVAAFHLQLYSESLQRKFNDTKSKRMTFL